MTLKRIPNGTQKVAKLFSMLTTPALLLQYANPARGFRRKLAVLAVAITWDLVGLSRLLPSSRRLRNAVVQQAS